MPKNTTHLWKHTTRRIRPNEYKDYYAVSIPPQYYPEFMNKELTITQSGNSIILTVSGCY